MKTPEELWEYARDNGLRAVGALLRKYCEDGQPEDFVPGATTRTLCRFASMGVEGIPLEQDNGSYMTTKYGPALYFHMWGSGDHLPDVGPKSSGTAL